MTTRFGRAQATRLLAGGRQYQITEAYPDAEFLDLFARVCDETGSDPDALMREFGVFAGERTFVLLYPSYFEVAGDARTFLLTVEARIHELVRATVPDADPPRLHVEPLGDDGVTIRYDSPRRLCVLLGGLVEGTARHYGEEAEIAQPECMLRGDPACRIDVRLRPAGRAPAAA